MERVFLNFYINQSFAFEVDYVKAHISRHGSKWVYEEFCKWLNDYLCSREVDGLIKFSGSDLRHKLLNHNWVRDNNLDLLSLRERVINEYTDEFAQLINEIIKKICLEKRGILSGCYLREEYDFGLDTVSTPDIHHEHNLYIDIDSSLLDIDDSLSLEKNPFSIKIKDLKQYFTFENALVLARERIIADKRYVGDIGHLKQRLSAEFISQLKLIESQDLRGLDVALYDVHHADNIQQFLIDLVKDNTIYNHLKTSSNLKEIIFEAIASRLECTEEEIQLNSFSRITNVSQPNNTCPLIDDNLGQTDTSGIEGDIENLRCNIDTLKWEISQLEESKYDKSEIREDEYNEDVRLTGINKRISEIEDKISDLEYDIEFKESCIEELEVKVRHEAERLRDSCSETRENILTYREKLYEYYKGMVYKFTDDGKSFLVTYPELESSVRRPSEWSKAEDFDISIIKEHGLNKALENYQRICDWGHSLTSLKNDDVYHLCGDAIGFDDLLNRLVEDALIHLPKKGSLAS